MKLFRFTAVLAAFAMIFACNPEEQPGGGGKDNGKTGSHERTLLAIEFEGQIGEATITPVDAETGTVEFQLSTAIVADFSQVEITTLTVSYGATCSVSKGDKIDLTAAAPTITVTAEAGDTRVYTLNMTTFTESFEGCYAITGSSILGGLGDATSADVWGWGVLLLASPEEKSWCWTKWTALGYGPAANYDNYLEVKCTKVNDDGTTEGTCINYGGVDGKHWNCLLDGAQNKEKEGQDLDLHGFYRVIPIGESTWKKDYAAGTITFKAADGTEHTCAIFDQNIEICMTFADPAKNKQVVVENQCLAFVVNGDTTWDEENKAYLEPMLYTDYLKFVIAPRFFFLQIKKVDEIPAESKVIGDEGDVTIVEIPDDPGPGPGDDPQPGDLSAFAGDYKVKSLNLYGGLYANGFVDIKSKPWDWTDYDSTNGTSNANKEYDNTLAITINGTTGTLNYGPGADGAYWDYTYKDNNNNYGGHVVDLSYNYGILPHGESTFSLNTETMVITITQNATTVYGMVFGPGAQSVENHDTAGKYESLTIPNGCIAIAFQMTPFTGSTPVYTDAMQYKDIDRFLFHPYYYAMVFEKQ